MGSQELRRVRSTPSMTGVNHADGGALLDQLKLELDGSEMRSATNVMRWLCSAGLNSNGTELNK
ncbi:MAG: hypothetical protein ABL973_08415 [Micropepsaceae bacterium]